MTDIRTLDLRTLVTEKTFSHRLGNDFLVFKVVHGKQMNHPFRVDVYCCFICRKGMAEGSIDLRPMQLRPGQMAINTPGQIFEQQYMSEDFAAEGIIMSADFVKSLGLPYNFHIDHMLKEMPLVTLQDEQEKAIATYYNMVSRLLGTNHPFLVETLRHLTCAFFYGIGAYLYKMSEEMHYSSEELLMQRFLAAVKTHCRRQRKVIFYADMLNITPNYLSAVVKKVSGKTPGKWIDDHVAMEARALLKGTTLTVQQISFELGFPSQTFFGK
ncbi:MAG: helix-turn-helix domain-containing protein, partial [Prevotella sp.]